MNNTLEKLLVVQKKIAQAQYKAKRPEGSVALIAVSKGYDHQKIFSLFKAGQKNFAENRIEEARSKWQSLKSCKQSIQLHFIGPLQSRKVKEAVELFDVIETLDREKILIKIKEAMEQQKKSPRLYVQVNTGCEPQKGGIRPEETKNFVELCRNRYNLDIEGLMCIPPVNQDPIPHFTLLAKQAKECKISGLSMGMSNDYEAAILCQATAVRIGRALFEDSSEK